VNAWESSVLATVPHACVDEAELGARPTVGLRRENYGLLGQRLEAITERQVRDRGWTIHYGADRMASSMSWVGARGAEV
jgi:hypothetical protein